MMDLGGTDARRKLFALLHKNKLANEELEIAGQTEFTAEEAKVQLGGDHGQGTRLTDAKKLRRKP